ncbi:DNA methyltransferase [Candidatus Endomicrobiellum trichonymphae]|uniref:DNA methyltransferase n=1 Tax=Endomicrobium trichonymphae TaxID=1408204 RepID=UPI000324B86F
MEHLVKLVSFENQIILDPFSGSCSTGVASLKNKRKFVGYELDGKYYKICKKKMENIEREMSSCQINLRGINMPKLFSSNSKKFLLQIDKPERELNKFIFENWEYLFPKNYKFIANEFSLKGNVRSLGDKSGKIDILGFNSKTKKFIIFELKKDYDRNITDQAADYRDYVQKKISEVYLLVIQEYKIKLPLFKHISKDPEIILIAKKFSTVQIDKATEKNITLIKYYWFEDFIFIDYLNNALDDSKIETADTKNKEINKIKNIISSEKESQDKIDDFFGEKNQSKAVFRIFLEFLESNGQVNLKFSRICIGIEFNNTTFTAISRSGKGSRKTILLVVTNIDVTALSKQIIVDDRYRGKDIRMKGSWGKERFEVYFRNADEVKEFCNYIKDKGFQPLQK